MNYTEFNHLKGLEIPGALLTHILTQQKAQTSDSVCVHNPMHLYYSPVLRLNHWFDSQDCQMKEGLSVTKRQSTTW